MGGGYQPYRRGEDRLQGPTLQAMVAGEGASGNPMDAMRQAQKQSGSESVRAPIQSQVLARFTALHAKRPGV